ncbi:MAG TPA: iron-containing alcohol dehydrogenase, partial [Polyangiaceae bacterium]
MAISQFSFPTRIQSGPGAVGLVAGALADAGKKRPLIVTDRGLAPLAPVTGTRQKLADAGLDVAVFSGIWGNPTKSQVAAGAEAYRAHGADCVVGLGGGAALDVAKAILVLVNHPGDLFDYEDEKPGSKPIDREIPYWVSVPTTAGTGSEVGRSAVVSDDQTHVKKIIFSPRLLAQRVFLDPELTVELPASVTAATGMDALTHLVEAYLAKDFHPLCDGVALAGLTLAARHLAPAVAYARRIEAGERALLGDAAHVEAR